MFPTMIRTTTTVVVESIWNLQLCDHNNFGLLNPGDYIKSKRSEDVSKLHARGIYSVVSVIRSVTS